MWRISIHILRVEDDLEKCIGGVIMLISIHILRVEDDAGIPTLFPRPDHNFNPHPPCGGWPTFPETPGIRPEISIHILRVEDDLTGMGQLTGQISNFNPHPPCGGWQQKQPKYYNLKQNIQLFSQKQLILLFISSIPKLKYTKFRINPSANPPHFLCSLTIRTKKSKAHSYPCFLSHQYAPLCFYNYSPGNKNAGYPFWHQ